MHDDHLLAARLTALHKIAEVAWSEPLARQQAFAAAMTAVLLRYARPGAAAKAARAEPSAIRRAMELARARLDDPKLGLPDLAEAAGLSAYYFRRCFRAATGVTTHAFVTQLRVVKAKRMLAHGGPSAEVALAVGFADQSHLIRRFRTALGVTPGQYARESAKRSSSNVRGPTKNL